MLRLSQDPIPCVCCRPRRTTAICGAIEMLKVWLVLLCICSMPQTHCQSTRRTVIVPQDAPIGHTVVELLPLLIEGERATLDSAGDFAHYFTIDSTGHRVVTTKSLSSLVNTPLTLHLILSYDSEGQTFERVVSSAVRVVPSGSLHFESNLYRGRVPSDLPIGSPVLGLERISVLSSDHSNLFHYTISNGNKEGLFELIVVDDPYYGNYAQLTNTQSLSDRLGIYHLTIRASDQNGHHAESKVQVQVMQKRGSEPVFSARRYTAAISSEGSVGVNVLRVNARSSGEAGGVMYRLEPDNLPFDVGPLSGDIFVREPLHTRAYSFDIVATDGHGWQSRAPVKISVLPPSSPRKKSLPNPRPSRYRRRANDYVRITLRENQNYEMINDLKKTLSSNERVKDWHRPRKHFSVDRDGTLHLLKQLNYEEADEIRFTVIIENTISQKEDRAVQVVVSVEDVDEPPQFLNRPLPFQTVVPMEAPIGFSVFKFEARDEEGQGDGDVEMSLLYTNPPEMFSMDKFGWVKTTKAKYKEAETYYVYVQAKDKTSNGTTGQESRIAVLDVRGGPRPPQFYEPQYRVEVPEDTEAEASIVHVAAKAFHLPRTPAEVIRYSLRAATESGASEPDLFAINPSTGVVRLLRSLDYEDPVQRGPHKLMVEAQHGALTSQVQLDVDVVDVNDNPPVFTQPLYRATVKEDFPVGETLLQVSIRDKDSGQNARVNYEVDDPNFTVDDEGNIKAIHRLDADQHKQGFYIYKFTVTATDFGDPPKTDTAKVHIRTENVNDEKPVFLNSTGLYLGWVAEDAQGNTPILAVQAEDPDRDQVRYEFLVGRGSTSDKTGLFEIDVDTGMIKLQSGVVSDQLREEMYNLTVLAMDDGSCCEGGASVRHSSTAHITISVDDVNDNKPVFTHCESYSREAKIMEGRHTDNKHVITVKAIDNDSNENGQVIYSLYYPKGESRKPFNIDARSGELTASPFVDFDRETRPTEDVTVKATDKGKRPLIGFCRFTVQIEDANDNAPQFDRASYETSISRSTQPGMSVINVFADDRDSPVNAKIRYELRVDQNAGPEHANDLDYFEVRPDSGEIMLVDDRFRNEIFNGQSKEKFKFLVVAIDSGTPPQSTETTVVINVRSAHQSAPVWIESSDCPDVVTKREDVQRNSIFFICQAESESDPTIDITYTLANGVKSGTNAFFDFRAFPEKRKTGEGVRDFVVIRNLKPLDFEKTPQYNLTITATDLRSGVTSNKQVRVMLVDINDEVPKFQLDKFNGAVVENKDPDNRVPVATVRATDLDSPGTDASRIEYTLLNNNNGYNHAMFRIDAKTGDIFALQKFDREKDDSFILDVEAKDMQMSDLPGSTSENRDITKVQIHVQDVNDNQPTFNRSIYKAKVKETAAHGQNVITVKADDKDIDSHLRYQLTGDPSPFTVDATSGTIKVHKQLDYESEQGYLITLAVSDGTYKATTKVQIDIIDENDNAPEFNQQLYTAQIQENNVYPQRLLKVTATDRDRGPESDNIVYQLVGQGTGDRALFSINNEGDIEVIGKLDRDEGTGGAPEYNFVVNAIDNGGRGLTGYSDVKVTVLDLNDNPPRFEQKVQIGYVDENKDPNDFGGSVYVTTVRAVDYDDPKTKNAQVEYEMLINKEIDGHEVFSIDRYNGKIKALMKLDRENPAQRQFEIEVRAIDKGNPALSGTGKVLVKVRDVNDNAPRFDNGKYFGSVLETAALDAPVLTVSAQDADDEALENVLQYELKDSGPGYQFFYMTSDPDTSGSNVGILRVKKPLDYEDKSQRSFTVHIQVFDGKHYASTEAQIEVLDANDNPPTINGPARIDIKEDEAPGTTIAEYTAEDPDFDGADTATFSIDRQTDRRREFSINQEGFLRVAKTLDRELQQEYRLRIVATDPAGLYSDITVLIYLADVNDNAPLLVPKPRPCIVWENVPPPQFACHVSFEDKDSLENGPPFNYQIKYAGSEFRFTEEDQSFNVTGIVKFDREGAAGKFRKIPVQVSDSGKPQQGALRYLEIVIGDKNDNKMSDGTKAIHVYSYKGQLGRSEIGRAFVEDADDWDLPDKQFALVDGDNRFSVDRESGMITMEANMPAETYVLKIQVTDTRRNEEAEATVNVNVEIIPQEAFDNSATIRLGAKTNGVAVHQSQFIASDGTSSPYERFKGKLAADLDIPPANVQIFSIMPAKSSRGVDQVDVRFAAHGSPYKSALLLHGTIQQNRAEYVKTIGIKDVTITQVSVDACLNASCDNCWNYQFANATPELVRANRTSLVGVFSAIEGRCGCPEPYVPDTCAKGACLNGGVCHDLNPGFFCDCSRTVHRGPQCQGRTRSFQGNGFAWFKPIVACTSANISLEFMTTSADALLLYNGPMTKAEVGYERNSLTDFLAIRLVGGQAQVTVELGNSGAEPATVAVGANLNDGKWHKLEFNFHLRDLELVIDRCQDVRTPIDYSRCRATAITAQFMEDERLNVMDPIQLGGVAPSAGYSYDKLGSQKQSLDGCIRNLVINEELYDLAEPAKQKGSILGCDHTSDVCFLNTIEDGSDHCMHGECLASIATKEPYCICDPGWHGDKCDKNITWYQFSSGSYIKYFLEQIAIKHRNYEDSKVLFITKQSGGTLFEGSNKGATHSMSGYLQNRRPMAKYKRGGQQIDQNLELGVTLADNQSYWMHMELTGTSARLTLDGLPGRYTAEHRLRRTEEEQEPLDFDSRAYFLGSDEFLRHDFQGCIADYRLNDYIMPFEQSAQQAYGGLLKSKGVTKGCNIMPLCPPAPSDFCPYPQVCVNFWKGPFCSCPADLGPVLDDAGRLLGCGEVLAATQLGITSGAVIAIILCLLALLIIVFALVVYSRRRRPIFDEVGPEYEGGTIINYDVEGGGENENYNYNIDALKKPVLPPENGGLQQNAPPVNGQLPMRPPPSDIGDVIAGRLDKADKDPSAPPYDELRVYDDEGDGQSVAGSLSSLSSGEESDVDMDEQLNNWGPRFQKLADMYGGHDD